MPTATAVHSSPRTGRVRVGQCESCRRHDRALFELDVAGDPGVMAFEVCADCE